MPRLPACPPLRRRLRSSFPKRRKEGLAALAASMSFVGVCVMLLGLMSATFALAAGYGGYPAIGGGLVAGASAW